MNLCTEPSEGWTYNTCYRREICATTKNALLGRRSWKSSRAPFRLFLARERVWRRAEERLAGRELQRVSDTYDQQATCCKWSTYPSPIRCATIRAYVRTIAHFWVTGML